MEDDGLVQYYRLCTVANGGLTHPSKKLPATVIEALFGGPKNMGVMFSSGTGVRVPIEGVIGGGQRPQHRIVFAVVVDY
jgi:hypothetical protein